MKVNRSLLVGILLLGVGFIMLISIICNSTPQKINKYIFQISKTNNNMLVNGTTRMKSILYWTKIFGSHLTGKSRVLDCKPLKCFLEIKDRSRPEMHDALIFHTRDPQNPPKKRRPNQVYVAHTWESPSHRGGYFVKGSFYNWSETYMRGSIGRFVHASLIESKAKLQIADLPQMKVKNKTNPAAVITWVVSNCRATSRRDLYVKELRKHIPVDVYGRCGKRCPAQTGINSLACYNHVASSGNYKFYLAFENSACKDYISYKPFRALQAGLVPIVLGGLSADDYSILPPHSYIDARNFVSPKHLSEYIKKLDKHDEKYLEYHKWRMRLKIGPPTDNYCGICQKLYDTEFMNNPTTLDWEKYWNPDKYCDSHLVKKLLGYL